MVTKLRKFLAGILSKDFMSSENLMVSEQVRPSPAMYAAKSMILFPPTPAFRYAILKCGS
jgi:hypothetical protein